MIFISEPISFSGLRQSTDTYLQLDASSFGLRASFHKQNCQQVCRVVEVYFAKFGNEKGNLLFCQNFYIILSRFWQAGQQLEPCSQACQNIIFKFQNSKV